MMFFSLIKKYIITSINSIFTPRKKGNYPNYETSFFCFAEYKKRNIIATESPSDSFVYFEWELWTEY